MVHPNLLYLGIKFNSKEDFCSRRVTNSICAFFHLWILYWISAYLYLQWSKYTKFIINFDVVKNSTVQNTWPGQNWYSFSIHPFIQFDTKKDKRYFSFNWKSWLANEAYLWNRLLTLCIVIFTRNKTKQ